METALAITVLVVTGMQLGVALFNLLAGERLLGGTPGEIPSVSVLIPARNEAGRIGRLLSDLLQAEHLPWEIIVCDDHSDDGTAGVVAGYMRLSPRVQLIRSARLPRGWTGKNFACHQLAACASGRYLLFLDADVRIGANAIGRLVATATRHRLGLLTVFPHQLLGSPGEKAVVPLMNEILLTLLPLRAVRKIPEQPALAAANGQVMLFDASIYRRLQPHREVRNQPVEDIRIARYYKQRRVATGCFTADRDIACRMYAGFRESLGGFSRSLPAFFGGSYLLAFLFWLVTALGFWPVYRSFPPAVFAFYAAVYLLIRYLVARIGRQPPAVHLLFWPLQQAAFGCILGRSLFLRYRKRQMWKGRPI